MDFLFKLSIILIVGLIGGRISKKLNLPNVTGYLVAGLFIGPSFFNLIKDADIQSFSIINEIALAAIAFGIGSEFELKDMLKVGKSVVVITVAEALGAMLVVFLVTYYMFDQSFAFSIVIASMSAATAPAATIMVINQYRADGPLTRTILPVVALDDAVGIMAFGIAMSMAKLSLGTVNGSFFSMVSAPFIEIFGSLLIGFILGVLTTYFANKAYSQEELLGIVLASLFASSGIANFLALSPLLTCMMVGATIVNLMHNSKRVFAVLNDVAPPIYLLFFTLAGASLHLSILSQIGALGIAYVFARGGGKMLGAALSAKAVKADNAVCKYLGLALLPQGGVSLGLSIIVKKQLPQYSEAITTVILFSILIYESLGPILSKIAIEKAGEINGKDKKLSPSKA